MIINELASRLDIDPMEVELTRIRPSEDCAEIVFSDEAQNGSGYVEELSKNWSDILKETIGREWCDCKISCHHCLQNYKNRNLHPLLDWRLGSDLLCILAGGNLAERMKSWKKEATDYAQKLVSSFGNIFQAAPATDDGWARVENGNDQWVIVHPFVHSVANPHPQTRKITTFNLKRRMSWCVRKYKNFDSVRALPQNGNPPGNAPVAPPVGQTMIAPNLPANLEEIKGLNQEIANKGFSPQTLNNLDNIDLARHFLVHNNNRWYCTKLRRGNGGAVLTHLPASCRQRDFQVQPTDIRGYFN